MNKYDFTSLVKDPKKLGEPDIEKLKALTLQFPYFSIAQNLLVKSLHNTKHYEYDKYLKQAALQTANRSVLYNLVHDLPLETESKEVMEQEVENLQINTPLRKENAPEKEALVITQAPIFSENKIEIEPELVSEPILESKQEPTEIIKKDQEELSLEDYFSNPEPIIEQISEPIIEAVPVPIIEQISEPIIEAVPVPIIEQITEPISREIEALKPEPTRDPEKIYEDEKLVSSTGKFVKFIPKSKQESSDEFDEVSLIPELGNPAEHVLEHFDITSLDGFFEAAPEFKSTIQEEPIQIEIEPEQIPNIEEEIEEPDYLETIVQNPIVQNESQVRIEPEVIENSPEPIAENLVANFEENTLVEDVLVVESESTTNQIQATDDDFLNWISNKETSTPENPIISEPSLEIETPKIIEPKVQIIEDHEFVIGFTEKFANDSNSNLSAVINETEPNNSIEYVPEPIVEPIVEPFVEPIPIETKVEPIAKVEPPIETQSSKNLNSLENYDVNLFLAPLYKQVSYNENLFEESFSSVYKGEPKANVEWTEPFVKLKDTKEEGEKEKTKVLEKEIEEFDAIAEYKPKFEEKIKPIVFETPEVKPKIADLPAPKIARDPGTVESILEKFMRENPSIARPKSEFYSPMNMAKQSAEESDEIVSETLAQIYTRQGLYKKAIVMYEKLGLHYPEKLPYFAGLISQIKSAHNID